jgi:peptidoglycan/xylan/chitin deacetylase (PgdA/CDA1 family)
MTKKKIVALTIDDGPSRHTAEISAALKLHRAKATFFVIGSHIDRMEYPLSELVRYINDQQSRPGFQGSS